MLLLIAGFIILLAASLLPSELKWPHGPFSTIHNKSNLSTNQQLINLKHQRNFKPANENLNQANPSFLDYINQSPPLGLELPEKYDLLSRLLAGGKPYFTLGFWTFLIILPLIITILLIIICEYLPVCEKMIIAVCNSFIAFPKIIFLIIGIIAFKHTIFGRGNLLILFEQCTLWSIKGAFFFVFALLGMLSIPKLFVRLKEKIDNPRFISLKEGFTIVGVSKIKFLLCHLILTNCRYIIISWTALVLTEAFILESVIWFIDQGDFNQVPTWSYLFIKTTQIASQYSFNDFNWNIHGPFIISGLWFLIILIWLNKIYVIASRNSQEDIR